MSIQKHKPCIGYINNLRCPYNGLKDSKCNIHSDKLEVYPKRKKIMYLSTSCCLCECSMNKVCVFRNCKQIEKHSYCDECANLCEENCPLCLSMMESID